MNIRVLIVDNEQSLAETVSDALQRKGYECVAAFGGCAGMEQLDSASFDVVITDLVMEDADGLAVLEHAKKVQPEAQVIMMTGHGSVPSAVTAMQMGAFTYLQKPLDLQQLRTVVEKASENARLRLENRQLQERLDRKFGFNGIIGSSSAMIAVIDRLKRIAPTSATVLIQGETGTGKELIAQALHQNSPRKNKPFVGINCAALSENILESELFGHVRGAFTDAVSDRVGKIEFAKGGTLFLDEVGDMPMVTQIKLLRVLESSEITRVGSNQTIKVDVRLLSATNRDLEKAVNDGTFRADLYHRIKVITVRLPGLRQRREDIPVLVDHFVKRFSEVHSKTITAIAPTIRKRLLTYDWPGNIRQLRNVIESMIVFDIDGVLDLDDAPEELLEGFSGLTIPSTPTAPLLPGSSWGPAQLPGPSSTGEAGPIFTGSYNGDSEPTSEVPESPTALESSEAETVPSSGKIIEAHFLGGSSDWGKEETLASLVGQPLDEIEKRFIRQTLIATGGNREEAAKALNIGQRTLYRKIKDYGL